MLMADPWYAYKAVVDDGSSLSYPAVVRTFLTCFEVVEALSFSNTQA